MADEDRYEEASANPLNELVDMEEALDSLEDAPNSSQMDIVSVIAREDLSAVAHGTPIYRLRLVYSKETFCAV